MKQRLSGLFKETLKTWARIANDVFPPTIHCGFCMQALAEFDGSSPHCKLPLY